MKKTVMLVVLFFVLSSLVVADGSGDTCSGFWGKMSCFLFGRGEAVVGKATDTTIQFNNLNVDCNRYPSQCQAITQYQQARQQQEQAFVSSQSCATSDSACQTRARSDFNMQNMQTFAGQDTTLINSVQTYVRENPNGDPTTTFEQGTVVQAGTHFADLTGTPIDTTRPEIAGQPLQLTQLNRQVVYVYNPQGGGQSIVYDVQGNRIGYTDTNLLQSNSFNRGSPTGGSWPANAPERIRIPTSQDSAQTPASDSSSAPNAAGNIISGSGTIDTLNAGSTQQLSYTSIYRTGTIDIYLDSQGNPVGYGQAGELRTRTALGTGNTGISEVDAARRNYDSNRASLSTPRGVTPPTQAPALPSNSPNQATPLPASGQATIPWTGTVDKSKLKDLSVTAACKTTLSSCTPDDIKKFPEGVLTLPNGKTPDQVTKIDDNTIHFNDGTVAVRNANPISEELYNQYKSRIDWTAINTIPANAPLPLKEGGSISMKTLDSGIVETSFKYDSKATAETVWSIDNEKFKQSDGWSAKTEKGTTTLTNSQQHREISFQIEKDKSKVRSETQQDQTITTTTTLTGITTVSTFNKDSKLISEIIRNKEGKVIERTLEYKKDQPLDRVRLDPKTGTTNQVCFKGDCGDNGEWISLTDIKGKGLSVCMSSCWDDQGKPILNNWKSSDEACKTTNNECAAIHYRQLEYYLGGSFLGALQGSEFAHTVIGPILGSRPGWEGLSTWWAPDVTKNMQRWSRDHFDGLMSEFILPKFLTPRGVCDYDESHKTKSPGQSATFIEVAPGVDQSVGSIHAEKTPDASPALCSQDLPCSRGECSDDGICMNNNQPVQTYFYKISWAVQAPQDESFTPYVDENGYAIKFNVEIGGDRTLWLYPAQGPANSETLQLENGASDKDTIIAYSPSNYNTICIKFGKPSRDLGGEEIHEICTDIVVSTQGQIEWQQSDRPGSSSSSTGSVRVQDVGRAQI